MLGAGMMYGLMVTAQGPGALVVGRRTHAFGAYP